MAATVVMMWAEPVIPTRPARAPFMMMPTSGRPSTRQDKASAAKPPKAPEMVVLIRMPGTWSVRPKVEPPLNPNQPNHSRNTPSVTSGRSWPWMVALPCSKRPMRGPMMMMAARLTQPPTECTTVVPAKSMKPMAASQPDAVPLSAPPQTQWPMIG